MKLLTVIGTRPEAIKMAPVIAAARRAGCAVSVCATAQHREMLDQVLALFGIRPDVDLNLMRPDQSLADLTARAMVALEPVLVSERPDWVLVQGDTTTAMVAGLGAFYRRIRVGHVEAGLRTGDLARPFPEEVNRRFIDVLSAARFVPTESARENLRREGAAEESLFVTGNTVVDALEATRALPSPAEVGDLAPVDGKRLVVVTAHRRESFGEGMRGIARAIAAIAREFPDVRIVYPVHPNPNVAGPMREALGGVANVRLVPPLSYLAFVHLMARAHLIVSDSGGVQEEAPSLGVPALVMRETTERPEAIAAGAVRLVGVATDAILHHARELLSDPAAHARMARAVNPYGDGRAAERIVAILRGDAWRPFAPDHGREASGRRAASGASTA